MQVSDTSLLQPRETGKRNLMNQQVYVVNGWNHRKRQVDGFFYRINSES
jgi:hypothetical protein